MKYIIYQLFIILFLVACSAEMKNDRNENSKMVEADDVDTAAESEMKEFNEEIEIITNDAVTAITFQVDGVEKLIEEKIQEISDLSKLINNSTLPKEMREEAKHALFNILNSKESIPEYGEISDLKVIEQDSNRFKVSFKLDNNQKEATAQIDKETIQIEQKVLEKVEVKIEEIK